MKWDCLERSKQPISIGWNGFPRCSAPYCGDKIKPVHSPPEEMWVERHADGTFSYYHVDCCTPEGVPVPQGP